MENGGTENRATSFLEGSKKVGNTLSCTVNFIIDTLIQQTGEWDPEFQFHSFTSNIFFY